MPLSSLLELRKFLAPEFVYGIKAAGLVGQYAQNMGMERVLLVTDKGLTEASWAEKTRECLEQSGIQVTVYNQITPNPRDHEVTHGVEIAKAGNCDGVVAIGGGSSMDCAKGIGIVVTNGGNILDYEGVDQVPKPTLPLICIPTTAGSSADVSQFAIINDMDRKVKIAIVSKMIVPDVALIDPELCTTMNRELTVHTGLDALTHAVEAYVSNASSPITDTLALQAVRTVAYALPLLAENLDNLELRAHMSLASLYAGLAFSNAILGAVHAMAHSLGGALDLPHGLCNAILLSHVMDFNFDAAPQRFIELGKAMGAEISPDMSTDQARKATLARVENLKNAVGMSASLSEMGVTKEVIKKLAAKALQDPCLSTNPKPVTVEDLERIYEQALG